MVINSKGLNPQQLEAVTTTEGVICVVASAGSGKTSVLTKRTAKLISDGINPSNILVVTFTKRAADEMKERLYKMIGSKVDQLNIGTFHSLCYRNLLERNYLHSNTRIIKDWQQKKIINDILKEKDFKLKANEQEILSFIGYQKNFLRNHNDNFDLDDDKRFLEKDYSYIYRRYEEEKEKQHLIDFGDMILKFYEMLINNKDDREYFQKKYRYICCDEAQDQNESLMKIIKILSDIHKNIFIVGDDKQSLYEFLGAKVENMLNFPKEYDDCKLIALNRNYRSSKDIVDLSNKLISHNKGQFKIESIANKPNYKQPIFTCHQNEDCESEYVSQEIVKLYKEGYSYKAIACLMRTNAYSMTLENTFIKKGIPYIIIGGQNFVKRKEIMDIIAYLRLIQNPSHDKSLERIVNIPNRFLGKVFIDNLKKYAENNNKSLYDSLINAKFIYSKRYWKNNAEKLHNAISHFSEIELSLPELIDYIVKELKYVNYLKNLSSDEDITDRLENIEGLKSMCSKFKSIDTFLAYINKIERQSEENNSNSDKVQIMTIHKSKGNEFPVVFGMGMSNEILPHKKSKNIQEERRVCYVCISRAIELLYVTYPMYYNDKPKGGSIFIENMIGKREKNKLEKEYKTEQYHADLKALDMKNSSKKNF